LIVRAHFKEEQRLNIWQVDGNGHDATHWKNKLWRSRSAFSN